MRSDLAVKCVSLGLVEPHMGLETVQGNCAPQRNILFLTQLLDLVETHLMFIAPRSCDEISSRRATDLQTLFSRDAMLVKQVAENSNHVFSTECKLFSNDIMSRLPNGALYVFSFELEYLSINWRISFSLFSPSSSTLAEQMQDARKATADLESELQEMRQKVRIYLLVYMPIPCLLRVTDLKLFILSPED